MSVEFYSEPPGKFDSRTLNRETLDRWIGRTLSARCSTLHTEWRSRSQQRVILYYVRLYNIIVYDIVQVVLLLLVLLLLVLLVVFTYIYIYTYILCMYVYIYIYMYMSLSLYIYIYIYI